MFLTRKGTDLSHKLATYLINLELNPDIRQCSTTFWDLNSKQYAARLPLHHFKRRLPGKNEKAKVDVMLFVPSLISLQSFRLTCRQILEMRQGPCLIPTIHKDVFTLTSPVCIVRDYVILGVCTKSPLSLPHARTLFQPLQLKERRFLSPIADL